MNSEKIKDKRNFVIEIKSREYHTWQGTISWIEGGQKQCFRSALELIKLIDSALNHEDE